MVRVLNSQTHLKNSWKSFTSGLDEAVFQQKQFVPNVSDLLHRLLWNLCAVKASDINWKRRCLINTIYFRVRRDSDIYTVISMLYMESLALDTYSTLKEIFPLSKAKHVDIRRAFVNRWREIASSHLRCNWVAVPPVKFSSFENIVFAPAHACIILTGEF